MSYNIDTAEMTGELFMKRPTALELLAKYKDDLPESNFFERMPLKNGDSEEIISLGKHFYWSGEGSGWGYQEVLKGLLSHTTGQAAIVFVWEGGDSLTGLGVDNGVVTEKKAKIVIEDDRDLTLKNLLRQARNHVSCQKLLDQIDKELG